MRLIFIFIGGGLGSILRFLVSHFVNEKFFNTILPLGTFTVNIIGSFLIGFLWGLISIEKFSPEIRDLTFIGILGGFTTFSSFMLETLNLIKDYEFINAFLNIMLTVISGFIAVSLGFILSKFILKLKGIVI